MLAIKPDLLRREVEAAISMRSKVTDPTVELKEQYLSSCYMHGRGPSIPAHENHAHDLIVNTLPAIISTNPAVNVRSRRPNKWGAVAEGIQHGLNQWVKDVDFATTMEDIALDMMFDFGVCLMNLAPAPGYEQSPNPPLRPTCTRISPTRFFADPQTIHRQRWRFAGHIWKRDKDDLMAAVDERGQPLYDHAAIKALAANFDSERFAEARQLERIGIDRVERNEIIGWDMHIPEHGTIVTMSAQGNHDAKFLRAPRKAFCPPWGCYLLFGFYWAPDELYPISPLKVTKDQVDEINAHAESVSRQADESRTLTIVNSSNSRLHSAVKNGKGVVPVPGFDESQVWTGVIGGPRPETVEWVEYLRSRLDRRSGLSETRRGNVEGGATATAIAEAAGASAVRLRHQQSQFRKHAKLALETAAWFMVNSNRVVFPLTIEGENGPEDATFYGGPMPGQEGFGFSDLMLDIEPYSMEQVNEAMLKAEMTQAVELIAGTADALIGKPWIDWKSLIDDYFETINIKNGSKYVRWNLVNAMQAGMLSPAAPQGGDPDQQRGQGNNQNGGSGPSRNASGAKGRSTTADPSKPRGAGMNKMGKASGRSAPSKGVRQERELARL